MNEPTEKTNESDALGLSVSLTEGIECFFDVGEHIIHVWGSAWSGRETVSVDGQVVSDTRNLTRLSACHSATGSALSTRRWGASRSTARVTRGPPENQASSQASTNS